MAASAALNFAQRSGQYHHPAKVCLSVPDTS
jgi:hypothetical protein